MDSSQYLPSDLLFEILSRLPVKSLLRFRCVSKSWLALVDQDTNFARSHLETFKNNRHKTHLFVEQFGLEDGIDPEFTFAIRTSDTFDLMSKIPFSLTNQSWSVVSSLHGLILLKSSTDRTDSFDDLKVWNPSIRKSQEIPLLLKREVSSKSLTGVDIGLGYDIVSNSYKIVKLICEHNTLHSIAIYALGADSWKIVDYQGDSCWHWEYCSAPIYFRGSLYLTVVRNHQGWDLVWYDFSKEVFSFVSMPPGSSGWKLVLIDGGSSIVAFGDDCSSSSFAWALDCDSMCWTKTNLYASEYGIFFIKKNIDMMKRWSFDPFGDKVISYNRETKEYKTLKICNFYISFASLYVESLMLHQ